MITLPNIPQSLKGVSEAVGDTYVPQATKLEQAKNRNQRGPF